MAYSRYVAIGDSQTEGLWDGDDSSGLLGFADRLAITLDGLYPGLQYANLAVRGRRVGDVLNEQLPQALSMKADLITVCVGMNDATLPGSSFERGLTQLDVLHAELARSGATVVTTTFPDVAKTLPVGRLLAGRIVRINDVIRTAATQYGFGLVDLYNAPSMIERDTWSTDRMHASTKGHILFAAAAAEALSLPGSNHDWAYSPGTGATPGGGAQTFAQLQWTRNMLVPWIWRHLRGRSAGDGRAPKRPHLHSVS
jgi:lysophospholipase L1-like esterase